MWLAAGVLLILMGALAGWFIYNSASKSTQVFVLSTAVDRGDVITDKDLTTLAIASGQNTEAISTSKLDEIVGKVATSDMPAGALVTKSSLADVLPGNPDQSTVGLLLSPQQMPVEQLAAGDSVFLVPVAPQTVTGEVKPIEPIPATVSLVKPVREDGKTRVDVFVTPQVAAVVANNAANDTIALYLAPAK